MRKERDVYESIGGRFGWMILRLCTSGRRKGRVGDLSAT